MEKEGSSRSSAQTEAARYRSGDTTASIARRTQATPPYHPGSAPDATRTKCATEACFQVSCQIGDSSAFLSLPFNTFYEVVMPAEAKHVNNMVTVTTLFWQDPVRIRRRNYDFKLEQILIWRNMIARNLTLPHEFVCIIGTMDQAGMVDLDALAAELRREGIRPVPLDKSKHVPGTVFVRLMLRRPDIGGILGPRIFMTDLDVVIVANIDSIVDRPEDSVWWRNPNYEPGGRRAYIQSSVQLFDAGARSFLYTEFDPQITPTWVNRRFGAAEQAWFAERLKWQDEAFWTEDDGIYGAMRLGDSADGAGKELPPNAKIISCPGQRAPWQEEMQKSHPWIAEHYR